MSCTRPDGDDLIAQAAGQRDTGLADTFAHGELPRPSSDAIRRTNAVDGRFDKGPPQPRRAFACNRPGPIPARARIDAWHEASITGEFGPTTKARDVADLGSNREREHRPNAHQH